VPEEAHFVMIITAPRPWHGHEKTRRSSDRSQQKIATTFIDPSKFLAQLLIP
jgi:hypothetical protein